MRKLKVIWEVWKVYNLLINLENRCGIIEEKKRNEKVKRERVVEEQLEREWRVRNEEGLEKVEATR